MTPQGSPQPIERWAFVLIGAAQGALIWLTGETLDDKPGGWIAAALVGVLLFLGVAPPLFYTLRANANRAASAKWALGLGAAYFLLFTLFFQRFGEDTLALPSGIGLVLAILASGALRATYLSSAEPFQTRLLLSCWSSALSLAVALLSAGIVLGLIAASAALVRFAGLKDVAELMTDVYVSAAAFGAAAGLMFALIAERDKLMDGVVQVIILAGRYLFVLVLVLIALALMAMVVGSVADLSRQLSVAGLSLGLTGAALLLGLTGQLQPPALSPSLSKILRFGWVLALPLVGVAAYATAVRIGQYGLTPERIFLIILCTLAALLVLGLMMDAVRPGRGWRSKTLGAFVGAAATTMVLSITPWLSWPDLANRNQAAQLAAAEDGLNNDAAHYLWHFGGKKGRAIVAEFEATLPDGDVRDRLAKIRKSSRYRRPGQDESFDQGAFFASLPVEPEGTSLPAGFVDGPWVERQHTPYRFSIEECQKKPEATCRLHVGELLESNQRAEVMLLNNQLAYINVFAWNDDSGAWDLFGTIRRPRLSKDASGERKEITIVPADRRDVMIGEQRYIIQPSSAFGGG